MNLDKDSKSTTSSKRKLEEENYILTITLSDERNDLDLNHSKIAKINSQLTEPCSKRGCNIHHKSTKNNKYKKFKSDISGNFSCHQTLRLVDTDVSEECTDVPLLHISSNKSMKEQKTAKKRDKSYSKQLPRLQLCSNQITLKDKKSYINKNHSNESDFDSTNSIPRKKLTKKHYRPNKIKKNYEVSVDKYCDSQLNEDKNCDKSIGLKNYYNASCKKKRKKGTCNYLTKYVKETINSSSYISSERNANSKICCSDNFDTLSKGEEIQKVLQIYGKNTKSEEKQEKKLQILRNISNKKNVKRLDKFCNEKKEIDRVIKDNLISSLLLTDDDIDTNTTHIPNSEFNNKNYDYSSKASSTKLIKSSSKQKKREKRNNFTEYCDESNKKLSVSNISEKSRNKLQFESDYYRMTNKPLSASDHYKSNPSAKEYEENHETVVSDFVRYGSLYRDSPNDNLISHALLSDDINTNSHIPNSEFDNKNYDYVRKASSKKLNNSSLKQKKREMRNTFTEYCNESNKELGVSNISEKNRNKSQFKSDYYRMTNKELLYAGDYYKSNSTTKECEENHEIVVSDFVRYGSLYIDSPNDAEIEKILHVPTLLSEIKMAKPENGMIKAIPIKNNFSNIDKSNDISSLCDRRTIILTETKKNKHNVCEPVACITLSDDESCHLHGSKDLNTKINLISKFNAKKNSIYKCKRNCFKNETELKQASLSVKSYSKEDMKSDRYGSLYEDAEVENISQVPSEIRIEKSKNYMIKTPLKYNFINVNKSSNKAFQCDRSRISTKTKRNKHGVHETIKYITLSEDESCNLHDSKEINTNINYIFDFDVEKSSTQKCKKSCFNSESKIKLPTLSADSHRREDMKRKSSVSKFLGDSNGSQNLNSDDKLKVWPKLECSKENERSDKFTDLKKCSALSEDFNDREEPKSSPSSKFVEKNHDIKSKTTKKSSIRSTWKCITLGSDFSSDDDKEKHLLISHDSEKLNNCNDMSNEVEYSCTENVNCFNDSCELLEPDEDPVDFPVPPLHVIEFVKRLPIEEINRIRSMGIKVRRGKFTEQEDTILMQNWQAIVAKYNLVYKPVCLLGIGNGKRRKKVLDFIKAKHIYQRLAHGLDDRTLWNVYRRARTLFHPARNLVKLTHKEVSRILKLQKVLGNKWVKIGEVMGKAPYSCQAAYEWWYKKAMQQGPWSSKESQCLKEAVKRLMNEGQHQNTYGFWQKVSSMVATRNLFQCRQHWLFTYSWKVVPEERRKWSKQDYAKLVSMLKKNIVDYENDVDWGSVSNSFIHCSPSYLYIRKKWYHLKTFVPKVDVVSHQKIVDYLYFTYIPQMLGKVCEQAFESRH